jgi:hypothetical protein
MFNVAWNKAGLPLGMTTFATREPYSARRDNSNRCGPGST